MAERNSKTKHHRPEPVKKLMSAFGITKKQSNEATKAEEEMKEVNSSSSCYPQECASASTLSQFNTTRSSSDEQDYTENQMKVPGKLLDQHDEPLQQDTEEESLEQDILHKNEQSQKSEQQKELYPNNTSQFELRKDLQPQLKIKPENLDNALNQSHTRLATLDMQCESLKQKNETLSEENAELKSTLSKRNEELEGIINDTSVDFSHPQKEINYNRVEGIKHIIYQMKAKILNLEKQQEVDRATVLAQQKEYEECKNEIGQERRHFEKSKAELSLELDSARLKNQEFQSEIKQLHSNLGKKESQLAKACDRSQQIDIAIQSEQYIDEEKTWLSQQNFQLQAQLATLDMQCESLKQKDAVLTDENAELKSNLYKRNEELERIINHANVDFSHPQKQADYDRVEAIEHLIHELKAKILNLEKQQEDDRAAVLAQQKEYEECKNEIVQERRHLKKIEKSKAEISLELNSVQAKNQQFQNEIEQLRLELQEKRAALPKVCDRSQLINVAIQSEQYIDDEKEELSQKVHDMSMTIKGYEKRLNKFHAVEETANKAMQALNHKVEILRKSLVEEEQKSDEIQKLCNKKDLDLKTMEEKFTTLNIVNKELMERLRKLNLEFCAAKSDIEGKKSQLYDEKKQLLRLKEDLDVAQSQIAINSEELSKTIKEEKKAKDSVAMMKNELLKAGKQSVEELRRSYEEIKEQVKQKTDEELTTAQQLKAYKRQLDDANEKVADAKERIQILQSKLDEMNGIKTENAQSHAQVHRLNNVLEETRKELQKQLKEKEKLQVGQQHMKRRIDELEDKFLNSKQESDLHIRQLNQKNVELENKTKVLQQSLDEAWAKYDLLRDNQPYQSVQQPIHSDHSDHVVANHHGFQSSKPANQYLIGGEIALHQQKRHTSHLNRARIISHDAAASHHQVTPREQLTTTGHIIQHTPNRLMTGHTNHIPYQQTVPHQQTTSRMNMPNNVHENPIIQDIDEEIQQYANEVRRDTQPPRTQEFNSEYGQDIPYDPNLTCGGCGQKFRFGEIQKLRRHINDFCTARQHGGQ